MGVGPKIKELRNKTGLTQKDLADQLHVTYQAVSRWENDDVEPSIDTLKAMCTIFNCSINEILDMDDSSKEKEEKVTVVEKIIVQEQKPVLGVCEMCNKPIYDSSDLKRYSKGRGTSAVCCSDCFSSRLAAINKANEEAKMEQKKSFKKRRIHSFIWPSIIALICFEIGIFFFTKGNNNAGLICLGVGVLAYCFFGNVILNNTFVTDMWLEVASWGFVKLPGIIFEFSIDGFVFLIAMKVLFFILGAILAIISVVFATVLALAVSIFVYPFALARNIKCKD